MWCINRAGRAPGAGPWWPSAIAFPLIAVWLTQYLLPRIKIDAEGVHRRIGWWWDLWPWEAFLSGQVRTGCARYTYEFQARAFWRCKLTLGYLEERDAESIRELIGRLSAERPLEPVPDSLILHTKSQKQSIELTREGIFITRKQRRIGYSWVDVQRVEVWRNDHNCRDFVGLKLQFPDQNVQLRRWTHKGNEYSNWTGGSPDVIATMVQQHVPPALIQDAALYGPAKTLEEIDRRQARDEARRTDVDRVMKWCVRIMWVLTAAMPVMFPWPKAMAVMIQSALLAVAMQWLRRDNNTHIDKRLRDHERQRAALLEERGGSDP
jgi:hypothetical protein